MCFIRLYIFFSFDFVIRIDSRVKKTKRNNIQQITKVAKDDNHEALGAGAVPEPHPRWGRTFFLSAIQSKENDFLTYEIETDKKKEDGNPKDEKRKTKTPNLTSRENSPDTCNNKKKK